MTRPYVMPIEQVRALVRLLYPDHMTPVAKRQIESACNAAADKKHFAMREMTAEDEAADDW